jgi:predicted nuclease with TOPRIM domain
MPSENSFRGKIIGKNYIINKFTRLLKNRKSARKSRKRRKAELTTLREQIKALKDENEKLKVQLKEQDKEEEPSSEQM